MTDQYKDQYKKETEQIHAPADLIARTKAAVRAEEARIQAERAAQTPGLVGQESGSAMQQQTFAVRKKHSLGAAARKWAYPLSAVAAIIVLVSVSMMMRGLGKSSLDSEAPYESAAAADCGGEESAAAGAAEGAAFEEAFPEAAAAAEEAVAEEAAEEAAPETEMADVTAGMAADSEDGYSDGTAADFAAEAPARVTEDDTDEMKKAASSQEMSSEAREMENAMSQKEEVKGTLADDAVGEVTVERVWKKPAFVNRGDAELHTYESKDFWVVKEVEGWAAYVESENGGGYVIRGEAETVEVFLEAGYKRIEEISF